MKELPKVYDPKQVESKIYDMWMRGGYFAGKADPDKKPFSIVMPPPNVMFFVVAICKHLKTFLREKSL